MFGLIKAKHTWDFAAFGKHPAAGDFLSLGHVTPLLKGFSSWMDAGYSLLNPPPRDPGAFCWHFWAKGPNSKLICGMIRNSQDKHGRPYPLMMAGEGRLTDTARDWDLIPFACERTWQILTYISAREGHSIKQLKRMLSKVKGPGQQWERYREQRELTRPLEITPFRNTVQSDFINKMNNVDGLSRKDHFSVAIDVGRPEDVLIPVTKLLTLLKTRSKAEPGTVFIGGSDARKHLLVLRRSLMTDDFKALWQTGESEDLP